MQGIESESLSKLCLLKGKRLALPWGTEILGGCVQFIKRPYKQDDKQMHFALGIMGPNELPLPSCSTRCRCDLSQGRATALCAQSQFCCWENLAWPQRTFVRARSWVHNAILPPCHTELGFHSQVRNSAMTATYKPKYRPLPNTRFFFPHQALQDRGDGSGCCFLGH